MSENNKTGKVTSRVKIIALLFIAVVVVIAIPWIYYTARYIYDRHTRSLISIENYSGSDIRFEKITINNEVVWYDPSITFKSKPLTKPWLSTHRAGPTSWFHSPKAVVELKMGIVNQKGEVQTLSCQLNNRSRPCFFEAFYINGSLSCSDCDDETLLD